MKKGGILTSSIQNYFILMIINSISYIRWQKLVQALTAFFLVVAIFFPVITFLCYIFEPDVSSLLSSKTSYKNKKQKIESTKEASFATSFWDREQHQAYIPMPEIKNSIFFTGYNYRPDANNGSRLISLSTNDNKLFAKEKERIYLDCSDPDNITFSKEPAPYSLIPISIGAKGLHAYLEVNYQKDTGETLYQASKELLLENNASGTVKISTTANEASSSLKLCNFYGPDKMISLLGGKEFGTKKNQYRLYLNKNQDTRCYFIKSGDILSYVNGEWKKTPSPLKDKPLFQVNSIDNKELKGTFWNETGFYQKNYKIQLDLQRSNSIHSFSFDKIYKRNNESVICKIQDRTFLLKPHDWLIKKNTTWHHVSNISEFNNLLNLNSKHEVVIFEGIVKEKDRELFIGYIFDNTRSNYKKLEIPLKKKETPGYNR